MCVCVFVCVSARRKSQRTWVTAATLPLFLWRMLHQSQKWNLTAPPSTTSLSTTPSCPGTRRPPPFLSSGLHLCLSLSFINTMCQLLTMATTYCFILSRIIFYKHIGPLASFFISCHRPLSSLLTLPSASPLFPLCYPTPCSRLWECNKFLIPVLDIKNVLMVLSKMKTCSHDRSRVFRWTHMVAVCLLL